MGWVIELLFIQLFCKVILDCWRLTVTWCIKYCNNSCTISLPSFTGNRNNIDIFLYNWRALGKRPHWRTPLYTHSSPDLFYHITPRAPSRSRIWTLQGRFLFTQVCLPNGILIGSTVWAQYARMSSSRTTLYVRHVAKGRVYWLRAQCSAKFRWRWYNLVHAAVTFLWVNKSRFAGWLRRQARHNDVMSASDASITMATNYCVATDYTSAVHNSLALNTVTVIRIGLWIFCVRDFHILTEPIPYTLVDVCRRITSTK